MCKLAYIGSDKQLPLIEWHAERPAFHIRLLGAEDEKVRGHFQKPHLVFAGAHTGCSCGFIYEKDDNGATDEDRNGIASVTALLHYLRFHVADLGELEFYNCWEGDWELPHLGEEIIHLSNFQATAPFELAERQRIIFRL